MEKIEVWQSGHLCTGMEGIPAPAIKIGEVEAGTFVEACEKLCGSKEFQDSHGRFDRERLTVWGCSLHDNEADARKSFG